MVGRLIDGSETHRVTTIDRDIDVTPAEEWQALYPQTGRVLAQFLERRLMAG